MHRLPALFLILLTLAAPVAAQTPATLSERIESVIGRPEFRHAHWGIEFLDLQTNQPVYALNADKLFVPGSTTKLLTAGTAMALLGAEHRFKTRIYRTGEIGPGGVLKGDLVLVASGDPNLSGRVRADGTLAFENQDHSYAGDPHTHAVPGDPLRVIRDLAAQVAAKGIRRVEGRVLVDASLFAEGERELGTGVVISSVVVNDNLVDLTVGPGAESGAPATLTASPVTSYVRFVNRIETGAPDSRPMIRIAEDVAEADGSRRVTVAGSFPGGQAPILYSYPVPEPSRFAQVVLAEALAEKGVAVKAVRSGGAVDFAALAKSYTDERAVAEHVSPPLREEVKVTLKVSQNLHASMTPPLLAALLRKDKDQTGFDLEREFLTSLGLDLSGAQQADGAGGDAHFTPAFMVAYLAAMAKRPDFPFFHAALPILGRDGTLFDIQKDSPAAGHVFAKTGTYGVDDPLNRRILVTGKGLAGYLTTADGRRLAFAIYVNNVSVSREPNEIKRVVGQALGEIAAAAYDAPLR
jgi:D-alanyl-D-alanine carboxypeptidase/D-alanyl-D-alanine-endopeptidase (penicillin-binding protein 4)